MNGTLIQPLTQKESTRSAPTMEIARVSFLRHPFAFSSVVFLILGMFAGNTTLPQIVPVLSEIPVAVILLLLSMACVLMQDLARGAEQRPVPSAMRVVLVLTAGYCWWLVASLIWAPSSQSLGSAADILVLFLSAVASYLVFASFGKAVWAPAWRILFVLAIVFAVGGFFSDWLQTGRMAAFGGGPNVFVRYMFIGMLASIVIYLENHKKACLLPLPLFASAAILSGSRGGLLASGVAALLVLGYLLWLKRFRLIFGLGILGVAGSTLILSFGVIRRHITELILGRYIEMTFAQGYSSGRDTLLQQAGDLIKEFPLLGTGVGGFNYYFGQFGGLEHPHNIFLTTWTESGPFGLIVLVVLWSVILVSMFRRWRSGGSFFAAVAAVAVMVCAQLSGYYLDARLVWFFAFMCLAVPIPENHAASYRRRISTGMALQPVGKPFTQIDRDRKGVPNEVK